MSMFIGPENTESTSKNNPFYVPEPSRWNRKLFYDTDTDLPIVTSKNIFLSLDSLDNYEGVSGIWSIWGKESKDSELICLDVHETLDVGYEIRMHEKDLIKYNSIDWEDKIYTSDKLFSLAKRMKAIAQYIDLTLILVDSNVKGKVFREAIEARYAWDTKSRYWNRNYFQAVTLEMFQNQKENDYIKKLR